LPRPPTQGGEQKQQQQQASWQQQQQQERQQQQVPHDGVEHWFQILKTPTPISIKAFPTKETFANVLHCVSALPVPAPRVSALAAG
jgi:hypothetical protein